jgi:hypothetical protein
MDGNGTERQQSTGLEGRGIDRNGVAVTERIGLDGSGAEGIGCIGTDRKGEERTGAEGSGMAVRDRKGRERTGSEGSGADRKEARIVITQTREELIRYLKELGDDVPDFVRDARRGTLFDWGFDVMAGGHVPLHKCGERPQPSVGGLSLHPEGRKGSRR